MRFRKFQFRMLVLLTCLVIGLENAWGEEYTIGWGTASGNEGTYTNFTATSGSVDGILSFSTAQNSATTNPAYNSNNKDLRLYYGNGNGGSITLTPATGITITGVVMTTSTIPSVKYTVDGGTATSVNANDNIYTISGISATSSLTIQNVNVSNTQLRIKTIKVTYTVTASYEITAVSNNESYGTVSVTGTTISATPNSDYRVVSGDGGYTVTTGTAEVTNNGDNTFKVSASTDCTVQINFEAIPTHHVTWSVNGEKNVVSYKEGAAISFPDNPADIDDKVFVGWSTATIDGTTDEAPGFVTSATMGDSDVTYYAVFATFTEGTETTTTDVLTKTTTGVSGTSYSEWSNKTVTSSAVYAGNSAGGNSSIQLRSSDNAGIVTTTSGGRATKIVVDWNSNTTNGRELTIFGKNTAYSKSSDLYASDNLGTILGSITKGTSTELTITGDYEYIGIRSGYGALYLNSISIYWVNGTPDTYSAYTLGTKATFTIAEACTDGENYYGTYSNTSSFVVPEGLTVSEITVTDGSMVVTPYETGDIVPANTGVMVKAASAGEKSVVLTTAAGEAKTATNMLKATGTGIDAAGMTAAAADCKYYRLTMHNGSDLGFWWGAAEGAAFALAANKAYLTVPTAEAARAGFTFGEGTTTSIQEALGVKRGESASATYYNFNGQKVEKPTKKGLYIVNGKKIVIK